MELNKTVIALICFLVFLGIAGFANSATSAYSCVKTDSTHFVAPPGITNPQPIANCPTVCPNASSICPTTTCSNTNSCTTVGQKTCGSTDVRTVKTCTMVNNCLVWVDSSCGTKYCSNGDCVQCRGDSDCAAAGLNKICHENVCIDVPTAHCGKQDATDKKTYTCRPTECGKLDTELFSLAPSDCKDGETCWVNPNGANPTPTCTFSINNQVYSEDVPPIITINYQNMDSSVFEMYAEVLEDYKTNEIYSKYITSQTKGCSLAGTTKKELTPDFAGDLGQILPGGYFLLHVYAKTYSSVNEKLGDIECKPTQDPPRIFLPKCEVIPEDITETINAKIPVTVYYYSLQHPPQKAMLYCDIRDKDKSGKPLLGCRKSSQLLTFGGCTGTNLLIFDNQILNYCEYSTAGQYKLFADIDGIHCTYGPVTITEKPTPVVAEVPIEPPIITASSTVPSGALPSAATSQITNSVESSSTQSGIMNFTKEAIVQNANPSYCEEKNQSWILNKARTNYYLKKCGEKSQCFYESCVELPKKAATCVDEDIMNNPTKQSSIKITDQIGRTFNITDSCASRKGWINEATCDNNNGFFSTRPCPAGMTCVAALGKCAVELRKPVCIDSDKTNKPTVSGKITGKYSEGTEFSISDTCTSVGFKVIERTCAGSKPGPDIVKECPKGYACPAGGTKCIKAAQSIDQNSGDLNSRI